jgi:hypothetical protein
MWLAIFPVGLLILAALHRRPGKAWRRGFVERVPGGRGARPLRTLQPSERVEVWRPMYDRLPLEQKIANGAWPFVATAVSGLPRCRRSDPAELIGKTNQRGA